MRADGLDSPPRAPSRAAAGFAGCRPPDGGPGDWFDPPRLFAKGYPSGITSALRALPQVRAADAAPLEALSPRRALEVGPGDAPLLEGRAAVSAPCYLDHAPGFQRPLRRRGGRCVVGDLRRAPFVDDAFDLAVASDVFTHISPAGGRDEAVRELARVARRVIIFNPEPGTAGVPGSAVPTADLVRAIEAAGLTVCKRRDFVAHGTDPSGYGMSILVAERCGSTA